jgi:DNA polymerase I-like protein with 3'-5' exonuclease and polymerase domains/intein/homing endonuclease
MSEKVATGMLDAFAEGNVQELINLHPWMKEIKYELLTEPAKIDAYIDLLISKGLCALDLEATGLNLRVKKDGSLHTTIVGVCLAWNSKEGVYIPVGHDDKEFNVPIKFIVQSLKRLTANCKCIFHNFKYDGTLLRNYGIIIENEEMYEDTMLMAAVEDASRRKKGLKELSEHLLKRPMIEIDEMGITGNGKATIAFNMVPPQVAVYYAASDAINTFALYEYFKIKINEQDPTGKTGPWGIYKIEKKCMFVTMEMERNLIKIDIPYLKGLKDEIDKKIQKITQSVYELSGHEFDINSPKQLGVVLFNELKIRYPVKERGVTGQHLTNEKVLSLLEKEAPIVKKILSLRSMEKLRGTYIDNFIKNVDEDGCVRFQLNQVQADTGRYSASGGDGLDVDGFCGVQCQNLPTYDKKDPDSVNIRKGIIARKGYKIVAVDYSGEELRIAANFSKEPKWIYEFTKGSADLHTMTGRIIYGKQELSKEERGRGKCVARGTLIASEKGWIPIENLKQGDKVVTHTGSLKRIEKVWDMGIKPGKRIVTKTGHLIDCGLNHSFLTIDNKWVRAGDLSVGMKIKTISCENINPKDIKKIHFNIWDKGNNNFISEDLPYVEMTPKWARLLGYLLGDGHIHPYFAGMVCSPEYEDIKDDVLNIASSLGLPNGAKLTHKKGAKNPLWNIRFGSTIFSRFCEHLGFKGRRGKIFRIPRIIFESPKEVSKEFLRGLFETDGTVGRGTPVSLCTKDIDLARDVILLLASFGIKAYLYVRKSKKYNRDYYQVELGRLASDLFEERIGFISCKKINKLKEFTHRPHSPFSPKEQMWEAEIKIVEDISSVNLMDLTIEDDHTYIAQGLVTHNTLNFLTLYGGGPQGFSAKAGVSVDAAKKMMYNFFKGYNVLDRWIREEHKRSRKRGYSLTAFGRRRPLKEYYDSPDFKRQMEGDRRALNSRIQGSGADILKIALWRVWNWKRQQGFTDDDIRILMPIHDEIVYEIKEEKLGFFVEHLRELMVLKDMTDKLKWEVPLEVDVEYGDSMSVDHDYFKEKKELEASDKLPEKKEQKKEEEPKKQNNPAPEITPAVVTTAATIKLNDIKNDMSSEALEVRTITTSNPTQQDLHIQFVTVVDKVRDDKSSVLDSTDDVALKDASLTGRLDAKGFYIYQISDTDYIRFLQLKAFFDVLETIDGMCVGPKCRVKIIDSNGEVLHKNHKRVAVDAFLALCSYFHI